jgi:hypothetical protein
LAQVYAARLAGVIAGDDEVFPSQSNPRLWTQNYLMGPGGAPDGDGEEKPVASFLKPFGVEGAEEGVELMLGKSIGSVIDASRLHVQPFTAVKEELGECALARVCESGHLVMRDDSIDVALQRFTGEGTTVVCGD